MSYMSISEITKVNTILDNVVKKMVSHTDNQKMAWWGLDNSFNAMRKNFTIKSWSEAMSNIEFDLRTNGFNDDIAFFDNFDKKRLYQIHRDSPTVKYVMDGHRSYVPCDLKTAKIFVKHVDKPKYIG